MVAVDQMTEPRDIEAEQEGEPDRNTDAVLAGKFRITGQVVEEIAGLKDTEYVAAIDHVHGDVHDNVDEQRLEEEKERSPFWIGIGHDPSAKSLGRERVGKQVAVNHQAVERGFPNGADAYAGQINLQPNQ